MTPPTPHPTPLIPRCEHPAPADGSARRPARAPSRTRGKAGRTEGPPARPAKGEGSMPLSSRAAWALGLGLLGAVALVAPSSAQNGEGQKAAAKPAPAVIAYADLDTIIKGY